MNATNVSTPLRRELPAHLFAGYPATTIAHDLGRLLINSGWQDPLPRTADPHQLLRHVHSQMPDLLPKIERALALAEIYAAGSASETANFSVLFAGLRLTRMPVAIASNNCAGAIRRWLDRRGYAIPDVVGHDPVNPARMKPAPDSLIDAMRLLDVEPTRAVFVGDAITDAHAAAAAGCHFIAFANKPNKVHLFASNPTHLTIGSLAQLSLKPTN